MNENEKQEPDMSATPAGISIQKIEEMVKEMLEKDQQKLTIWTGYGGAMEYARSWLKTVAEWTGREFKEPTKEELHNEIRAQIAAGWIKYNGQGGFQIG